MSELRSPPVRSCTVCTSFQLFKPPAPSSEEAATCAMPQRPVLVAAVVVSYRPLTTIVLIRKCRYDYDPSGDTLNLIPDYTPEQVRAAEYAHVL